MVEQGLMPSDFDDPTATHGAPGVRQSQAFLAPGFSGAGNWLPRCPPTVDILLIWSTILLLWIMQRNCFCTWKYSLITIIQTITCIKRKTLPDWLLERFKGFPFPEFFKGRPLIGPFNGQITTVGGATELKEGPSFASLCANLKLLKLIRYKFLLICRHKICATAYRLKVRANYCAETQSEFCASIYIIYIYIYI